MQRPPQNASDILAAARSVVQRVYALGLTARLTRNDTFTARLVTELVTCTAWDGWGIAAHALDTGELCHATGVGLDWAYAYLSQPEHAAAKAAIVAGMVRNGLAEFKGQYEADAWWTCT